MSYPKLAALNAHSSLALNRELLTKAPATWDEAAIGERSLRLAERIIAIWPGPGALLHAVEQDA